MQKNVRTILYSVAVFGCFWLGFRFLLPLAAPFLVGAALAGMAEPMAKRLRRLRVPRGISAAVSVSTAFLFLGALVILFSALILREARAVAGVLPDLGATAKEGISQLETWLLGLSDHAPMGLKSVLRRNVTDFFSDSTALLDKGVSKALSLAGTVLIRIPDGALGVVTAILSAFLFSARMPRIRRWVLRHFPKEKLRPLLRLLSRLKTALFSYLAAQLKLCAVAAAITFAGLCLLKVSHPMLWALVIAFVDILPVLGSGTVLIPWALVQLIQGSTARAAGLLGTYIVVTVTRSVLEPRFLGKNLGLDPLVTLMAMYAGYRLWGVTGLILSPILAVTALQIASPEKSDA